MVDLRYFRPRNLYGARVQLHHLGQLVHKDYERVMSTRGSWQAGDEVKRDVLPKLGGDLERP